MDLQIKQQEYLIFDITKATTRDGRPYLKVVLADANGSLANGIMFDTFKLDFEPKKGDTILMTGVLQQYNGQNQIKVAEMTFLREGGAEAFLPKSKLDPNKMAFDLRHFIDKYIEDEHLVSLVKAFYADTEAYELFLKLPAAKTVHHAYIHGLLEHTLGVVKNAVYVATLYPHLNRELLIIGALFHDIGKVRELSAEAGFEYTSSGKLMGHLMLGYTMLDDYMRGIDGFPESYRGEILHMIASHHGQLEFGSPQVPKTMEAMALSHIDDLDAKLNNFAAILERESVDVGGWSGYDRLLERQIYRPR
jgi:3'-5' exoribonuclease